VVCSNNDSILHRTACDLEKSFIFETTVEIVSHDSRVTPDMIHIVTGVVYHAYTTIPQYESAQ